MGRLWLSLLVAFSVAVAGCSKDDHEHDHDHESHSDHDHDHDSHDHDHDHDHDKGDHKHDHGHENDARYGGKMNEVGDHFAWIEVLVDNEDATLTLWIWDAHVDNPMRVKAKSLSVATKLGGKDVTLELAAQADVATGETVGDTQKFEIKDDRLKGIEALEGKIVKLTAKGTDFENVVIKWDE